MKLRYLTAGESHGPAVTVIIDGLPAHLEISAEEITAELLRRQRGYGRGRRMQIEHDEVEILSGIRFGKTLGSPVALLVRNNDWKNWSRKMNISGEPPSDMETVTVPRPGHADYAGGIKYDTTSDMRNVLERASARETTMRVAVGAIAKKLLQEINITVASHVVSIGTASLQKNYSPEEIFSQRQLVDNSVVRSIDTLVEQQMKQAIDKAKERGDTLGGIAEVVVLGMPVGVGSHVQWDRKLDGLLSQALISIQACKGVEVGLGFTASGKFGSEVHDPFAREGEKIFRTSNNAGGIEGGMSNGEPIVVRAAMKPISTLMEPLDSIDLATGEKTKAHIERSDTCAVPAFSVIAENIVALTLADALLDTFGGDTLKELKERVILRRSQATFIS